MYLKIKLLKIKFYKNRISCYNNEETHNLYLGNEYGKN